MAEIQLERLTKVYADGTRAVHELDLEIADGEFVVFVGPSGCGKTTALRMVAGLEDVTEGTIWIGDEHADEQHGRGDQQGRKETATLGDVPEPPHGGPEYT